MDEKEWKTDGYLMEAQIVLNGVRGVEDGPTGSDNQDESIESLLKQMHRHGSSLCFHPCAEAAGCDCHQPTES